jgi:hypothetical protein
MIKVMVYRRRGNGSTSGRHSAQTITTTLTDGCGSIGAKEMEACASSNRHILAPRPHSHSLSFLMTFLFGQSLLYARRLVAFCQSK